MGAIEISGLTADSRQVRPGYLFAALTGLETDGARFAGDAAAAGAAAILAARDADLDVAIPVIRVNDPRRALSLAAARFYGGQPDTVVAVTGTSGKTSVASFVRQIFEFQGYAAASLGTIGVVSPNGTVYGSLTTPDPVELHRVLRELADGGVTHAALEASSHGLDQRRLDGVRFAAGAFTNLGRDHLDYHPTREDYFAAKMRLFEVLLPDGVPAVIDADTADAVRVADIARSRGLTVMNVGRSGDAIRLLAAEPDGFRQRLTVDAGDGARQILLPLVGGFQVSNALVAAGLAIGTGSAPDTALAALERLDGAKGRLELVGRTHDGALIFIDYAHKPDAIVNALQALRPFTRGRLSIVIGAGGDRDRGKRPLMGRASVDNADVVYVTDDNPRSEEPADIRAAILSEAPGAIEIGDRRGAIHAAVGALQAGDILLVAGKGHETGQIVKGTVLPFSDHDVVAEVLQGEPVA
ncbi:UDP-N-acetylmuramoyl-L-alanyl-D-glutamate--2,6-diaminopimelate ligase [Microbaculum marinum]|uniref:UDP-N-acetylmuramoyl-L-alanyl-D-glutamate--2,6-diaminopimelate ligase n=1 Tax=Microbaculum marinum TaxID=1764581 RepID=A0AAW9RIU7_9HYPH